MPLDPYIGNTCHSMLSAKLERHGKQGEQISQPCVQKGKARDKVETGIPTQTAHSHAYSEMLRNVQSL